MFSVCVCVRVYFVWGFGEAGGGGMEGGRMKVAVEGLRLKLEAQLMATERLEQSLTTIVPLRLPYFPVLINPKR